MPAPVENSSTQQAMEAKAIRDLLLDVQSQAYGHATTYTAVIIFGGYASLFTIWTYTKDHLSETMTYWVALLLGISVLAFVFFEVFKMLLLSREMLKIRGLLVQKLPPAVLLRRYEELSQESNFLVLKIFLPIWVVVLIITITSGVGAAVLLLWAFASALATT